MDAAPTEKTESAPSAALTTICPMENAMSAKLLISVKNMLGMTTAPKRSATSAN